MYGADRFDGSPADVFDFQDDVTEKVVVAIAPRVERAEIAHALRRSSDNTDAYDCYLKGLACLFIDKIKGISEAYVPAHNPRAVLLSQKSICDNRSHHARENQQCRKGLSDHWPRRTARSRQTGLRFRPPLGPHAFAL